MQEADAGELPWVVEQLGLHSGTLPQKLENSFSGDNNPYKDVPLAEDGSPSPLSGRGEGETQEKSPGAEPQFLLYEREMPRVL